MVTYSHNRFFVTVTSCMDIIHDVTKWAVHLWSGDPPNNRQRQYLPKFAIVANSDAQQLFISGRQSVPFPTPFAPSTRPLSLTARITQPHQGGFAGGSSDPRQTGNTVRVLCHQTVSQSQLTFAIFLKYSIKKKKLIQFSTIRPSDTRGRKHTYQVDAGYEKAGTRHGAVQNLIRQITILIAEAEALHDTAGQILQRSGRRASLT